MHANVSRPTWDRSHAVDSIHCQEALAGNLGSLRCLWCDLWTFLCEVPGLTHPSNVWPANLMRHMHCSRIIARNAMKSGSECDGRSRFDLARLCAPWKSACVCVCVCVCVPYHTHSHRCTTLIMLMRSMLAIGLCNPFSRYSIKLYCGPCNNII